MFAKCVNITLPTTYTYTHKHILGSLGLLLYTISQAHDLSEWEIIVKLSHVTSLL